MKKFDQICAHCESLQKMRCSCYHEPETRCYCYYSTPSLASIEDFLTWIIIGLLIVCLYNTIKLCLLIFFIACLIYWISRRIPIARYLERLIDQLNLSEVPIVRTIISQSKQEPQSSSSSINPTVEQKDNANLIKDSPVDRSNAPSLNLISEAFDRTKNHDRDHDSSSSKTSSNVTHESHSLEADHLDEMVFDTQPHPLQRQEAVRSNQNILSATSTKKSRMENISKSNEHLLTSHPSRDSSSKSSNIQLASNHQHNPIDHHVHYGNSVTQAGYYGPVHTVYDTESDMYMDPDNLSTDDKKSIDTSQPRVLSDFHRIEPSKLILVDQMNTTTALGNESKMIWTTPSHPIMQEPLVMPDIVDQTKEIRQAIFDLHEDVLRLCNKSDPEIIDLSTQLSNEDRALIKITMDTLIQRLLSSKTEAKSIDDKSHSSHDLDQSRKQSKSQTSPLIFSNDRRPVKEASNLSNHRSETIDINDISALSLKKRNQTKVKLEHCPTSEIILNRTGSLDELKPPTCLPVQASVALASSMPRVPNKATVIGINDDQNDKEIVYGDDTQTLQQIVISADQFENIPNRKKKKNENSLSIKPDAMTFNDDHIDWIEYLSKHDVFPNAIQSDLPVIQHDDHHSSLKQSILSHFHHRPKLINNHHSAALHATSLNAAKNVITVTESNTLSLYHQSLSMNRLNSQGDDMTNSMTDQHHYAIHQFLSHGTSSNRRRQRIFRVRKSRIHISFDDGQSEHEAGDSQRKSVKEDHQIDDALPSLITNDEQQTQISDRSIMSLVQSFDSVIRQGELAIHNEPLFISIGFNNSNDHASLASLSCNSLYSVASQPILT